MLNTKKNMLIQIVDTKAYFCHRKISAHQQFNQCEKLKLVFTPLLNPNKEPDGGLTH
jgi:hypothetical protein